MVNKHRYSIIKSVIHRGHIIGFVIKAVSGGCTIETLEDTINHHKLFGGITNVSLRKRRTVLKGDIEYLVGKKCSLYEFEMLIDVEKALRDYPCSLDFLILADKLDF